MENQNSSYQQKIQQEAQFWGKIAEEQLDDGMIPDLRRATKKGKVVSMWDEPEVEKMMRGMSDNLSLERHQRLRVEL